MIAIAIMRYTSIYGKANIIDFPVNAMVENTGYFFFIPVLDHN